MAVDAEQGVDVGRAGRNEPAGLFLGVVLFGFDLAALAVENFRRLVRLRKLRAAAIALGGSQPVKRLQAKAESAHGSGRFWV